MNYTSIKILQIVILLSVSSCSSVDVYKGTMPTTKSLISQKSKCFQQSTAQLQNVPLTVYFFPQAFASNFYSSLEVTLQGFSEKFTANMVCE